MSVSVCVCVGVGVGVCLPWQAALAGYKQVDFVGVSVGVWVCGCVGRSEERRVGKECP